MNNPIYSRDDYFMDDPREGQRLEKKANAGYYVNKYLKKHLTVFSAGKILEVGCGSGAFLESIARDYPNLQITGIDISTERIAQAADKLTPLKNGHTAMGSVYQIPFPDNHFDFIYSRFLFEYLKHPIDATNELFRVCKPDGKLVLQDLDGQFTFYPAELEELPEILEILSKRTGFDPNVGRKLFSYGKSAGFTVLQAESELYHGIFGRIDDQNYDLWNLKLDIAAGFLADAIGKEKTQKLKSRLLSILLSENSVMFSSLFTLTFEKRI